MNFIFLYSMQNAHNSSIAKNHSFHNYLNRYNFVFVCFFSKKFFHFKKCLHEIFILVRQRKLIAMNFIFLYSMQNAHNSSIAKNHSFHNYLNRYNFALVCFFSKKFFHFKIYFCLGHGAYLNSTSNVFAYFLIINLGHYWFGFCFK